MVGSWFRKANSDNPKLIQKTNEFLAFRDLMVSGRPTVANGFRGFAKLIQAIQKWPKAV